METTFYGFQSNLRYFLSQLLKDPINCKVGEFFKDRNFSKKKLINILIKRDVIKRHEKIDDDDSGNVTYKVTYKIMRKNFERKLKRIYNKYFETPDTEIDEATAGGGCCGDGFTSTGPFITKLNNTLISKSRTMNLLKKKEKNVYLSQKNN